MNNFIFQNPTKLIFGKNTISQLSVEIPRNKKILLTFGGGSVKSNGVYSQVIKALSNHDYIEFWGIEPNPKVETLRQAIKLARENKINYLLAVGGGSVLDATKLIAASILFDGDPWELVISPKLLGKMLPYASVMTLPATGSEMNRCAVISNIETKEKFSFYSDFPQFSILDPETTFSLPKYQIACGLADTFVHVMEQYLTKANSSLVMDRWAEGILISLIELAPKLLQNNINNINNINNNIHDIDENYTAMANFMLAATMALNGFIAMGATTDWATHRIGHEITALEGITHAQTLTVVLPGLMSVMREQKQEKLLQYANRVWNINTGAISTKIDESIIKTKEFFKSLGLATSLSELELGEKLILEISSRFNNRKTRLGEEQNIDGNLTKKILEACL